MKSSKIFAVAVLAGVLLSSCTPFHRCEAYTYHEDPVEMKQIQQENDNSMLEMENEVTCLGNRG